MALREPFVLLDDARTSGASDARFYRAPQQVFVARRPEEVAPVLAEAHNALSAGGGSLAGYIGYEAGLALENRLAPLAPSRSGAAGPLVWLGLFAGFETIPADQVPAWLAGQCDGAGQASVGPLVPQVSLGAYQAAFARLQQAIHDGDIYQANLTFPLAGSYRGDPLSLYAQLRPSASAGYGGVLFDGSHWLLCHSPELFVSLADGSARVKPMKGTRPRGRDADEDRALKDELAGSEKDRAENLMIVDLMRNDLSRVAEPGSVTVERPFTVETYPTVHQMVSTVHARMRPDADIFDLLGAMFPCGSITGAPKIRAMELIAEVERDARGPYCGAIGRIDAPDGKSGSGSAAFNVAIRTMRLSPVENGQGRAVLAVGSAIVADSQALPEWRECLVKGEFVRQSGPDFTAAQFDLIETMRFDPAEGIALLELHLERMKASAAELGFAFDRHAARNEIQALCFSLEDAARVRLILARSGATALEVSPFPPMPEKPLECALLPLPVFEGDWRLRHKTSDRDFYEDAREVGRAAGADEVLFLRDDGLITEGSFTNLFIERGGKLLTPAASLGLLPGVLRRSLMESGRAEEADLTVDDLAQGFLIGNALRGLVPARLLQA